jgi:peptidoglycan/LPS O-acetylase OafA/YrhL
VDFNGSVTTLHGAPLPGWAGPETPTPSFGRPPLGNDPVALDVFFILSGFLIGGIQLRARNAPHYYQTFYQRRASRILPVYYAWIAFFSVLFAVGQGWGLVRPKAYSSTFYLASFAFFFQNFFPSLDGRL